MFEKFTQKAIEVVQSAQNYAQDFKHCKVLPEHLVIGLVAKTKGVQAKILNFDKINFGDLNTAVFSCLPPNSDKIDIPFDIETKNILNKAIELSNKLNSKFVMPQHIALVIMSEKNSSAYKLLEKFNIDEEKIAQNLTKILDKSADIKVFHPEEIIEDKQKSNINDFFAEKVMSEILSNAQAKATTQGFEIMGTEQILLSILDNKNYPIVDILDKFDVTYDVFSEKLSKFTSRNAEFENSEKQIIFTPNAFQALVQALDCAKEFGSVSILPEHIILGILKSKKGIAYRILADLIPNSIDFEDFVIKKLNDKLPETLTILRLAKEEARALNSCVVGSEMILLGILSFGKGVAYDTLKLLGINLKDAREEVKKLIKPQKEKTTLSYSPRAKEILEIAYETAQEHDRKKIKSENILYGITKTPNCIAMEVLSNLGTDVLEIRQGIKQELLCGMDL